MLTPISREHGRVMQLAAERAASARHRWREAVRAARDQGIAQDDLARLRAERRAALLKAMDLDLVGRCRCGRLVLLHNLRYVDERYVGGGTVWADCPSCGTTHILFEMVPE